MIYIAHFTYLSDQQEKEESERRHGEFTLVVEAENERVAIHMFRERINLFKDTTEFFSGKCRIYFLKLLEMDVIPDTPVMLIYKSVAGDPLMPYIECTVPSRQTDGCSIYEWQNDIPNVDGEEEMLFMEFDS